MLVFNYTLEISITSENILLSLDVTFTTSYLQLNKNSIYLGAMCEMRELSQYFESEIVKAAPLKKLTQHYKHINTHT